MYAASVASFLSSHEQHSVKSMSNQPTVCVCVCARVCHCKTRRVVLTRLWSPQLHLRAPLHVDQGMSTQVQPTLILLVAIG